MSDKQDADKSARQFHIGAQNDAVFIISGEKPALNNDYPRHDADRTVIAKVLDEAEAQRLVDAANAGLTARSHGAASTDIQVCANHAEAWFCGRNHLPSGYDHCIVCCFYKAWEQLERPSASATRTEIIEECARVLDAQYKRQCESGCVLLATGTGLAASAIRALVASDGGVAHG